MRARFIIGMMLFVLLGGYGFSLFLLDIPKDTELDMVYINEVVKSIEEGKDYEGKKIYEYQVIPKESLEFKTKINDTLKNREIVMDLNKKEGSWGKVIFYTNFLKSQREAKENLIKSTTIIFIMLFCMGMSYLFYLQKSFYGPFKKLRQFAQSIAAGNLDLPLDMDKKNVFGPFTESFDLMREEIKTARYKEEQANNSKRELIASLSHDIKTPVASIKAVSELLLAISDDEKKKAKLGIIYEKAEQIDGLITDMFHATLEELGELKVNPTEEYSHLLYELIKKSDYNNKTSVKEIPSGLVLMDPLRLGQVLDNVIANSYKYADSPIEISFLLREQTFEIEIEDTGKGMNPEELSLVFNKFYRGTNAKEKNGSGLGLYISKYLMKRQEGDIVCFNTESGFRVRITLKLVS